MKVAYFSPLSPERTGIADYSALLLPALRERIDVTVVRRGARRPPRGADVALYHVGNNPDAHGWIVEALRRERGIVVLHDFVLHHLVAGLTLGRGKAAPYLDAMQRDAGVPGRLVGHGVIDGLLPPPWEERPHEFPLAAAVLDHAEGVIVHSRYVEERVRETGFAGPVWRVPHPAWRVPDDVEPLPLPRPASIVIGCFGNLNESKRAPQLLRAFAKLRDRHPDALLVFAGGVADRYSLELHSAESGLSLGESVLHLGFVDEDGVWPLLAACDVLVSLRWPTMGETSGSAIRTLAAGRPLVVSDVGWFSELPDTVAAKVPLDETEVETLVAYLDVLCTEPGLRERMGRAARDYVRTEHDLGHAADLYVAAIEEGAGGAAVLDEVVGELAHAASDVGIDTFSPELGELAARVREIRIGV